MVESVSTSTIRHKNAMGYNTLSFQALRAKFQPNHQVKKATTTVECMDDRKERNYTNTMPKRIATVAKNFTDLSDHLPLKRNIANSSSFVELPKSTTTSSLCSNNSSSTATEDRPIEIEEEEGEESTSRASVPKAVPRTGSFVNELSKRLAQSERNGEAVSHITSATSRRSVPLGGSMYPITTAPRQHSRKSVPTSVSAPSLLKLSTTGSSAYRMGSRNSPIIANGRRCLSSPPPPLPDQPTLTRSSAVKRARVVQELISTEKSYQADMELVQEIYVNDHVFSKLEIKQIFINLSDIIAFEKEFVRLLESCQQDDYHNKSEMTIGIAFSLMMHRMDHIYGDYCKRYEDAVCKIQELSHRSSSVQSFFTACKEKIQGRTMCWDLPSLLIKPVQRVLKYPLLLREIVALTPEFHRDFDQLAIVTKEIQQVADHINEIKRRKELVEQLMSDKKKMDKNLINKTFTRKMHRKKQMSTVQDAFFDTLHQQFESKQEMAKQFEKVVQDWVVKILENTEALSNLVDSLESVYGDSDGIGLRSISAFKQLVSQLKSYSVENMVQGIYDKVEAYLKLFQNPAHVIDKRNRKLFDYDRLQHLLAKGEIPDKQMQLSAEQYLSLNAHLLDELPTFISLSTDYFNVIVHEFTQIQATYWRQHEFDWKSLAIELPFGKKYTWSCVGNDYQDGMHRLEYLINEIKTKPQPQLEKTADEMSLAATARLQDSYDVSFRVVPSKTDERKKYDSLINDSQPTFQCIAQVDHASPEKLRTSTSDSTMIDNSSATSTEWSYVSKQQGFNEPVYGWIPSNTYE